MSQNIKKYLLPALLILALLTLIFKPSSDNLLTATTKIQSKLNDAELFFQKETADKNLIQALRKQEYQNEAVTNFTKQNITLCYYISDSIIFWSGNQAILLSSPHALEEGTSFTKLKNGWFQVMKHADSVANETVIALLPVKNEYPFENRFLKNSFALGINLPNNLQLSEQKIDGSLAVKDVTNQPLFYLYIIGDVQQTDANIVLLFAQLLLILIAAFYVHQYAVHLAKTRNLTVGFFFLVSTIVAARAIMLLLNQPVQFYKLELFDPKYYASSVITPSLGDLIINSISLFWIVMFYSMYKSRVGAKKMSLQLQIFCVLALFSFTALVWWVFKTLVMDSVISFEVYNILSLNWYSLLGLLCLELLLASHFVFSKNILLACIDSNLKQKRIILLVCVAATLFSLLCIQTPFYESLIFSTIWAGGFVMIVFFLLRMDNSFSTRSFVIYISLYSFLSAYLVENLYERKERNQRSFFSSKLVSERDFVAEYLFEDVAKRVKEDGFIKNYFSNPLISQKEVKDRINALYFGGFFDKYSLKLYSFDGLGNSIKNEDTSVVHQFKNLFTDSLPEYSLHYISDTAQNYSYVSLLRFRNDSVLLGSFIVRLTPKVYYGQNVYPELLLGNNVTVSNNINNYSYAIYQNDKMIAQYGDFPYSYYWNKAYDFNGKDFQFIEEAEWEHGIQRFVNGKKVLVSVAREPEFEPVATFSYFFTFYISLAAFISFLVHLYKTDSEENFFAAFSLSFRTRINYSMLLMILFSFVIIGFITISFFSKQYDNFYSDRLLRKEKVVHASLEYFVQQRANGQNLLDENVSSDLDLEVARLAEINAVDINLYNRSGDLEVASQPVIYEKGLVSKKMNPAAYFDLRNYKSAQVTKQESIGGLSYLATYAPIRNNLGESIAYLGIPYFERTKNIDDEISSFLVALMNVYVFLLICAAVLAYFISNSITRPLTIISEKLRILNLNKTNEPIEWNSKDEIGVLVSEYNKMITELEQSAQKLAKGERETAWREMAKQIAHEIKNPLTPMKLSIQYLQRAIDEGNPNIEELTKKVTKTLDEQIENLSSIATAFSSFAKMPKAQNEIIQLNELLKSITNLFAREEAEVSFNTSAQSPFVFADKNQLVSVFNNLVKNAIQSIPEHRKGFVDVHVHEEDGWIITSVSDNGTGIPRENYEQVFVPNFTTKSSGTGLGLAITKQIIDGAGGKIWFESEENVGTTFLVKLRRSENLTV